MNRKTRRVWGQEWRVASKFRAQAFDTQDSDRMPTWRSCYEFGSSQIWIKSNEHGGFTSRSFVMGFDQVRYGLRVKIMKGWCIRFLAMYENFFIESSDFLKWKELIFGKFCTLEKKREFVTNCCSFSVFEDEGRRKNTLGLRKGWRGEFGRGGRGGSHSCHLPEQLASFYWLVRYCDHFSRSPTPNCDSISRFVHSTKSTYQRTENLTL
jgi:hypothetical protein